MKQLFRVLPPKKDLCFPQTKMTSLYKFKWSLFPDTALFITSFPPLLFPSLNWYWYLQVQQVWLVYFLQKRFLKLHCVNCLLLFFPSSPLHFSVTTKYVNAILLRLGSVLFIEISQQLTPFNIYRKLSKYVIVKFINFYVLFWLRPRSLFFHIVKFPFSFMIHILSM